MSDARSFDDAREFELRLLGAEVLEKRPALPEDDRDEVDLELVEDSRPKTRLGEVGPVHQHVGLPGGVLGLTHGARDPVGDVVDQLGSRLRWLTAGRNEDRDAVMVASQWPA